MGNGNGTAPIPGPDTRVVELRTCWSDSAEEALDAVAAVDVAGDGEHRLARPADRLRRPAPGPVLQAGGRSTPRITEAYLPRVRRGWLPFGLLDVARWALPSPGGRAARVVLRWVDVLLGMVLVCVPGVLVGSSVVPPVVAVAPAVLVACLLSLRGLSLRGKGFPVVRLVAGLAVCAGLVVVGPVMIEAVVGALAVAVLVFLCVAQPVRAPTLPVALRPFAWGRAAGLTVLLAGSIGVGLVGAAAVVLSVVDGGAALPVGYNSVCVAWLGGSVAAGVVAAVSRLVRPDFALCGLFGAEAAWRRVAGHRFRVAWLPVVFVVTAVLAAPFGSLLPAWVGYLGAAVPVAVVLGCRFARGPVLELPDALRAADSSVAALAERVREHLAEHRGRVVLAGHGHGALFATLAALELVRTLPDEQRGRLGLLTAGAPVRWLYLRLLPCLGAAELAELSRGLGGRWRALCRGTDRYGGAVTTWRTRVAEDELSGSGLLPGGGPGELPAASVGEHGVRVLGGDHWLPDPAPEPVTGRRWVPGVRGHRDYACEPEWDAAVALAAGLSTSDVEQQTLFRLPASWRSPARRPA